MVRRFFQSKIILLLMVFLLGGFLGGYLFSVFTAPKSPVNSSEEKNSIGKTVESTGGITENTYNVPESTEPQETQGNSSGYEQAAEPAVIREDTSFIFREFYTLCNHTIEKKEAPPPDCLNNNRQDIQNKYQDWDIVDFTPQQVVFLKFIQGKCPEHYLVRLEDGNLMIYNYYDGDKIKKIRTININMDSLDEEERKELVKGVQVNSDEELASIIEDFSS